MRRLTIILIVLGSLANYQCFGSPLYVDPVCGDDSSDGESWATALKTMTRAAELIPDSEYDELYLAEGTFSEATGEVFPITFDWRLIAIHGSSREGTVIDSADAPHILLCNASSSHVALTSLSFHGSPRPGTIRDDGAMIEVHSGGLGDLYARQVSFVGLSSPTLPILGLRGGGLELVDCAFLDCDAEWLSTENRSGEIAPCRVTLSDCVFVGSFNGSTESGTVSSSRADLWSVMIQNCRFEGTRDSAGLQLYTTDHGLLNIWNCSFENFLLETYGYQAHFAFSSFRHSTLRGSFMYREYMSELAADACIFDSTCTIELGGGILRFLCSWCSVPPILLSEDACYGGTFWSGAGPYFVEGPLGGLYLSNEAAGQYISSPCLSLTENCPLYQWAWPPEGTTTRTDGVPDEEPMDIGYHYPSVPPPPPSIKVETDRQEYQTGDEMSVFVRYENRGVKVEGGVYVAFGPESLDWLVFWPTMTFVPTPWVSGTLYSGISYPNLPPTTHAIPDGLPASQYWWLAAVIDQDGAFASDISAWPITIAQSP